MGFRDSLLAWLFAQQWEWFENLFRSVLYCCELWGRIQLFFGGQKKRKTKFPAKDKRSSFVKSDLPLLSPSSVVRRFDLQMKCQGTLFSVINLIALHEKLEIVRIPSRVSQWTSAQNMCSTVFYFLENDSSPAQLNDSHLSKVECVVLFTFCCQFNLFRWRPQKNYLPGDVALAFLGFFPPLIDQHKSSFVRDCQCVGLWFFFRPSCCCWYFILMNVFKCPLW